MPKTPFEEAPYSSPPDETEVNLRAHFDAISEEQLASLDAASSDEELRAWDGNFRSDGCLMLVCCDRDVGIDEYRRVLSEFLQFRKSQ